MDAKSISYEHLIAYAAGDLTGSEAESLRRGLEADPSAKQVVRRFQHAVEALRSDDSVAAPADVLMRAKQRFAERRVPSQPGWLDSLAQMVADLVYDSRPQLAAAGVRGSATAYQLSFECELADIDLEIERYEEDGAELCRVTGQVSVHGKTAWARTIAFVARGADKAVVTVTPDQHGTFDADVVPGVYYLAMNVSEKTVVLADVEIE